MELKLQTIFKHHLIIIKGTQTEVIDGTSSNNNKSRNI